MKKIILVFPFLYLVLREFFSRLSLDLNILNIASVLLLNLILVVLMVQNKAIRANSFRQFDVAVLLIIFSLSLLKYEILDLVSVANYIVSLMVYFIVLNIKSSDEKESGSSIFFLYLFSLVVLFSGLGGTSVVGRPVGEYLNINQMANYAVYGYVLVYLFNKKSYPGWVMPLLLVLILYTQSRSALLGYFVFSIIFLRSLVFNIAKKLKFSVAASSILLLFIFSPALFFVFQAFIDLFGVYDYDRGILSGFSGRELLWDKALLEVGLFSFTGSDNPLYESNLSSYVDIYYQFGFVGLLIVLLTFSRSIKSIFASDVREFEFAVVLISIFSISFFESYLWSIFTPPGFVFVLLLASIARRKAANNYL